MQRWPAFKEANPVLQKLAKGGVKLGLIANIDDKLLGQTRLVTTTTSTCLPTARTSRPA